MASPWHGLFPALWTPTRADGDLDTDALIHQARFLVGAGVDGLMVLGSTGEFPQLELRQRREVLRHACAASGGRPVIANCSDVNPRRVAELGRFARECGARAMALMPPWFYASAPEDVAEFLVRGADEAGLPLVLYNYPERTGHRLDLRTIATVCDRAPVVALKQSGNEFEYHRDLAELGRQKGFVLISGSDVRMAEAFALGAEGIVSGLANAVPEWLIEFFRATRGGDAALGDLCRRRLERLVACLKGLHFPLDVLAAMRARGRVTGEVKPVLSAATLGRLEQAVAQGRKVLAESGVTAPS